MAAHTKRMIDLGVAIIGGCCGTSTEHLAVMRQVIDGELVPEDIPAPGPPVIDDEGEGRGRGGRGGREGRRRRRTSS